MKGTSVFEYENRALRPLMPEARKKHCYLPCYSSDIRRAHSGRKFPGALAAPAAIRGKLCSSLLWCAPVALPCAHVHGHRSCGALGQAHLPCGPIFAGKWKHLEWLFVHFLMRATGRSPIPMSYLTTKAQFFFLRCIALFSTVFHISFPKR